MASEHSNAVSPFDRAQHWPVSSRLATPTGSVLAVCLQTALDFLVIVTATVYATTLDSIDHDVIRLGLGFALLYTPLSIYTGLYNVKQPLIAKMTSLAQIWVSMITLLALIGVATDFLHWPSHPALLGVIVPPILAQAGMHSFWHLRRVSKTRSNDAVDHVIILGEDPVASQWAQIILDNAWLGQSVVRTMAVGEERSRHGLSETSTKHSEFIEAIDRLLDIENVRVVYVLASSWSTSCLKELSRYLSGRDIMVHWVPDILDIGTLYSKSGSLAGTPYITVHSGFA